MGKKLETRTFTVEEFPDAQCMISSIIAFREDCSKKYKGKCICETKPIKGVGIMAIIKDAEDRRIATKIDIEDKGDEER